MRITTVLSPLLGISGVLAHEKAIPRWKLSTGQDGPSRPPPVGRRASSHKPSFLTSKSEKFVVNGTGIPEVEFDIGESYAGRLPIDVTTSNTTKGANANQLFFWFFPSENPAASKEITIWLNGGPGCSSMVGVLQEHGPFLWQPGTYSPQPNPFSWNKLTNMIYVDQPIGTGLASAEPGAEALITNETQVAEQFAGFWKNFVDTFDMHGYDVYVTGESYAGFYVPYIASYFLDQNDTTYHKVKGMGLIDPIIGDRDLQSNAPAKSYVEKHKHLFNLNETIMADLSEISEFCGYDAFMKLALTFPPAGKFPSPISFKTSADVAPEDCYIWADIYYTVVFVNPCFNIYHITDFCPFLYNQLGYPSFAWGPNNYFNRSDVQAALNLEPRRDFIECETPLLLGLENSPPSSYSVLPSVVERTNNVFVANGDLDFLFPSNGTLAILNNMTWNGAQGFSSSPFANDFFVPYNPTIGLVIGGYYGNTFSKPPVGYVGGGGSYGKTHTERGLTFVTVNLAGHQIPQYVPGAGYRLLEFLLGRVGNLSAMGEFTTF